jgi:hypothetical protein
MPTSPAVLTYRTSLFLWVYIFHSSPYRSSLRLFLTCFHLFVLTPTLLLLLQKYSSFGGTWAMTLGGAALTSVKKNSRPQLMSQRTSCTFLRQMLQGPEPLRCCTNQSNTRFQLTSSRVQTVYNYFTYSLLGGIDGRPSNTRSYQNMLHSFILRQEVNLFPWDGVTVSHQLLSRRRNTIKLSLSLPLSIVDSAIDFFHSRLIIPNCM